MDYKVKNLKTWDGRQGVAASGTLVLGRAQVASFRDDANGGCMMIYPHDKTAYAAWQAWVAGQDLRWPADLGGERVDFEREDFAINRIVDAELTRRQFARWCRKDVVFRLVGDRPGHYRRVPIPEGHDATSAAHLVRTHYLAKGREVEEVANETYRPSRSACAGA